MAAASDENKEPGSGWMYTGAAPADGRVVVVSSTLASIPVESMLHIPTEEPERLDKVLEEPSVEAPPVVKEEPLKDGRHVIRIAAGKTRAEATPLESVEPPDLAGVPENLKEYVTKLSQRGKHLDL